MATIIELQYFNTFWLKKIKKITDVVPGSNSLEYVSHAGKTITISGAGYPDTEMNVGQQVTMAWTDGVDNFTYDGYVVSRVTGDNTKVIVNLTPPAGITAGTTITFGKIINFDNIPQAYDGNSANDWILEESRIRGGYNNVSVDLGVKAYAVEDEPNQSHRFSSLIHSGIFNSRTGINQTNQFSVGEDITRTIDPANGSIQKLYAEDTNLIIFQENKVSKSLIDKDAIYSAEGNASVTSRNLVIGQNVAFAGEYGIGTDPESFAVNGYRKYFTDRDQNVVCRLSMDGITVISSYGMTDFFRDTLASAAPNIRGGWDAHNKQYVVSIKNNSNDIYNTLSFDETSKGWTSFFDYNPNQMFSLNNNYFTAFEGKIYKHYEQMPNIGARGMFYGNYNGSSVKIVFNAAPSMVKNFQTINYEGDSGWTVSLFRTNTDSAWRIEAAQLLFTLEQMQNSLLANRFKKIEDSYYATLSNKTSPIFGQVLSSSSSSGVKGFFAEVTMTLPPNSRRELFAVSTEFVKSH